MIFRLLFVLGGFGSWLLPHYAFAQRVVAGDTLYGHEWIDRSASYLKVAVTQPGVVSFSAQLVFDAGWDDATGAELSLWHMGKAVPFYVSTQTTLSSSDRLSFIHDPEQILAYEAAQFTGDANDMLSTVQRLVSDTAVYFLRRGSVSVPQYRVVEAGDVNLQDAAWTGRRQLRAGTVASFYKVESDQYGAKYSSFRRGEGWGTPLAVNSAVTLFPVDATAQPGARLSLRSASSFTLNSHVRSILFGGTQLRRDTVGSAEFSRDVFDIPGSVPITGAAVNVELRGLAGSTDRHTIGDVLLDYTANNIIRGGRPIRFTAQGVAQAGGKLGLLGLRSGDVAYVYHLQSSTIYRVEGRDSAAVVVADLREGDELQVALQTDAYPVVVRPWIIPEDVREATQYLVISSRKTRDWREGADAWSAFRQNPVYGGYHTQVVAFEDLTDLYGYGTPNDPQALRSAITRAVARGALENVLLLGKGREFTAVRTPTQLALPQNRTFYCPTYGYPASDNLITYNPLVGEMIANVGRVAAESSDESAIILRKTRATEDVLVGDPNLEGLDWIKQVLHISGGSNANEQATIQRGMRGMEEALASTQYGPTFSKVFKNASVPVQSGDFDAIFSRINAGVSFVTFFGHGSTTTFEIQFDTPERYKNVGKYPPLFAYGCYAGNANLSQKTIGERFVLMENGGFSMFAATTGLGYPFALQDFGSNFYRSFGAENYDKPLAASLRKAANLNFARSGYVVRQQAEQFLLQGDPALVAFKPAGPDIVVDGASLRVGPEPLIPSQASFDVSIDLRNLGRGIADTFRLVVERSSALRPRQLVDTLEIAGFAQRSSVKLTIPSWNLEGAGLNQLYFTIIDVPNEGLMAGALQNNAPSPLGFFVADAKVRIVYPVDGERLTTDSLRLYAEFGRPLDGQHTFEWQISDRQDFATLTEYSTLESGSLSSWRPALRPTPGKRYHARCRTELDSVWSNVTFAFSEDLQTGLALETPQQFAQGKSNRLSPLRTGGWSFDTLYLHKEFKNLAYTPTARPSLITGFESPYVSMRPWAFTDTAVSLLIVDNTTGYEIFNEGGEYGSLNFGTRQRSFTYHVSTKAERQRVVSFIDSVAKDGSILFFFTVFKNTSNFQPDTWVADSTFVGERTLLGVLREQGALRIVDWIGYESVPYTFIFRKGVGPIVEALGASTESSLLSTFEVPLANPTGEYTSPALGPFTSARSLRWEIAAPPNEQVDELQIELLALSSAGDTTVVMSSADYSGAYEVSAELMSRYPYYLFRVNQTDADERTPNAILRFSADGDLRPELVYDPDLALNGFVDTVFAGATPNFELGLRNVSPLPITQPYSLLVKNVTTGLDYSRDTLASLPGWGTYVWHGSYAFPDERAELKVGFELSASPEEGERISSNNIAFTQVQQNVDEVAPTVRILVDGEQLRERELLPPSPRFVVELRDDLTLDPQSLQPPAIRLTLPDGAQLSGTDLPGTLQAMTAATSEKISYSFEPGKLPDGVYSISVRAADRHGNTTENLTRKWTFEIANTKAISNVLPYPNPMVDRVRFQYELTGEVPSDYQINIFTTSGRLVRSLGPPDLGALKIGRQLTSGTWDGTDQFGQRLARGTYLYRFEVATTSTSETFEDRATGTEKYFKSGFGKLVVLR